MQDAQLGNFGLLLLVLLANLSLFGLIKLNSSRLFRTAPACDAPRWTGLSVLLALAAFLLVPGIIMGILEESWDTGLYSSEIQLRATSITGGYLLGGGLIAYLIWSFVVGSLGQSSATLGLRGAAPANLLPVVLVYVLFIVPLGLCAHIWIELIEFFGYEPLPQEVVKMFGDAVARGDRLEISLLVFNAVILAPLWEELIYRGFFFGLLKSRWGVFPALVFSSVVFSCSHFSLAAFLPLLIVGIAIGYVYHRTGSLYFAIFFHALFNGLSMAIQFISAGS